MVRELIANKANVDPVDRYGNTPLADAARHRNRHSALEILAAGGTLAYEDTTAAQQLLDLARKGDAETIKLLLDCKVNAKVADYDGRTVAHVAASEGHKHIIDMLAMRRAVDFGAKDRWDCTALDDAIRCKHQHLAETLAAYFKVSGHEVPHTLLEISERLMGMNINFIGEGNDDGLRA
jgi:ankyrin repeat protein